MYNKLAAPGDVLPYNISNSERVKSVSCTKHSIVPLFRIISPSLTLTAIITHCSGYQVLNLCSMHNINKYGCSMLNNEFSMALNNSVWTPLHCKALSVGSNGIIAILYGGIVTTVDVFGHIPRLLVTESTLMSIT